MAQLAFGLGGAALGSFTGIGANTGYILGSILGRILFPDPPVVTEGPRLGDLNISSSTYGAPIHLAYGTVKISGNLIWHGGVREVANQQEVSGGKGGLGGPTQVHVTYSYFTDFAFGFATGPAEDVLRLWFDNELVYDKRGQTITKKTGLSFHFYNGDETQLPDPTIEAKEGVGQVPGHRGLVYIVFTGLDVTGYGGRVPKVDAEIAFLTEDATSDRISNDFTIGEGGLFSNTQLDDMAIDFKRRRIYLMAATGSNVGLRVYDLDTLQEIRQQITADLFDTAESLSSAGEMVSGESGYIYMTATASNTRPWIKIDPNTLNEVDRFGFASIGGAPPDTFPAVNMMMELETLKSAPDPFTGNPGKRFFLVGFTVLGDNLCIADAFDMSFLYYDPDFPVSVRGMCPGRVQIGEATGWIMTQTGAGNSTLHIHKLSISAEAQLLPTVGTYGVESEEVDTIDPSVWNTDGEGNAVGPIFDKIDGGLIFIVTRDSSTGSYVIKWREGEGVVWVSAVDTNPPSQSLNAGQVQNVLEGFFGFVSATDDVCLIDTITGEVIETAFDWATIQPTVNPIGRWFYDGETQSVVVVNSGGPAIMTQIFLNRKAGLGTTDGAIVRDISQRVGLDINSDIDTSELTADIRGYAVTRQMPARSAIEPVATAFFFDGVESDDKVVFKKRGRDPIRTIVDDDLVPSSNETNDVVQESRAQEVELPERVSVAYIDYDRDYQESAQAVKRVRQPIPTMRSRNEAIIPVPIVLVATEAEQLAEKLLFTAWNERTTYSWRTPWEHLDLDPADVVNLELDNLFALATLRTRITKAVVNLDLTVSFEGLSEDKVTVESDSTADGGLGFPQQVVPGPAFTRLFLMDIPLLRDTDNTGGSGTRLYFTMNGLRDRWPGGILFDSNDGFAYNNTGLRQSVGVSYGTVINKLPITTTPFQTDEETELRVLLIDGELQSVTESEFLSDANAALVGNPDIQNWEIITFQNAVQQPDSSYILTNIMRARRGTDPQVNTHTNGETFLFLTTTTINAIVNQLTSVGVLRFYKGVGRGQLPEDADIEPLTSTGADLKPYAPVQLDAIVDGGDNIDLSWVRRSRVGGELRDGVGEVPLAEETEAYEIDILDGPGGAVLRTLTSTTPMKQYDNADIITDFGSVPASLSFVVYQMSAAVGRGYGAEATITF